jgi:hypothetical protein
MPFTTSWRHAARAWARALSLATAGLLAGCGGSCLNLDGPEFESAISPAAVVGQPYQLELTVNILRTLFDDQYHYSFSSPDPLPPGLELKQVGTSRRVQIVGVPTKPGSYVVRVDVSVGEPSDPGPDPDLLCWNGTEVEVKIDVAKS